MGTRARNPASSRHCFGVGYARSVDFVRIDAGEHELGWRFSQRLPSSARAAIERSVPMGDFVTRFSAYRRVRLPTFDIASSAALTVEGLLGDVYELDGIETLLDACDACDAALLHQGLRLPTEDELEAAFAGQVFPWGDTVPDGLPYTGQTSFAAHKERTGRGLWPLGDTYHPELTRTALKLGDGGEAVCGGYPWPIAWFSLCPSFRLAGDSVDELLFEFLETTHVRPVRR